MQQAGFLGPDSVAWRVHADPAGLIGGIRSLTVQALHPRAMAAVAQHSAFRSDFWGRLQRTSNYLFTVVYGTRAEAEQASAVVRAVHARISGTDTFTGLAYRADEPALLTWVHLATVESYLTAHQRYGRSLSADEADRYVDEMAVLARLVGVADEAVPHDVVTLRSAFGQWDSRLAASPEARAAVRTLLDPPLPGRLKLLWQVPAAAAVASLPDHQRRMLRLPWSPLLAPGVEFSAATLVTALRLLLPPPPQVEAAKARGHGGA